MKVRIKVPFTRCRALPSSLICLQVQVHDSDGGERSSNVVGERDIVYKPEKILALKDIDPEERMNWSKRSLTLRIPTVTVPTVPTVGTVQLYLGATMHRSPLGTIHWCTR